MSDEKRFTNKKLIAVSIMLVLFIGATGVLGFMFISVNNNYTNLSGDYDSLYIDHLELLNDFNNLDNQYFILTGEHIELENDYNVLVVDLADMTTERDNLLIQIDILNAEISVHLTTISGLNDQIGVLEAEIIVLEEQAIIDAETIADLNAQIVVLNTQITNHLATISGLETELTEMTGFRDALQFDLDALNVIYTALLDDYQILFDANADLQITYDALSTAYEYITNAIRQSILPVQFSIFAEAVRRYCMPLYLEGLTGKDYWLGYAEFSRDLVLHDTGQYNAFLEVSNAFDDALKYGSATMYLADYIMDYTFDYCNTIDWWGLDELTGYNELSIVRIVVQQCIDNIDYEYDSDIIGGQEYFDWDYIKFSVETAFRTKGDCEDQAILTAAYLESCGLETVIAISHDPAHPTEGAFYHGSLLVHIEDTDAYYLAHSSPLWTIPYDPYSGYTWAWLDTTWDVPFGTTPSWLQDYSDFGGLTMDVLTIAYCDIGGAIGTNTIENIDITCVMST